MSDTPDTPGLPEPPPEPQSGSESGPKIGVDSWVASHGDRSREKRADRLGNPCVGIHPGRGQVPRLRRDCAEPALLAPQERRRSLQLRAVHASLHRHGAGAQRRRRLRGSARPRLRGGLRHRRVRLRAPLVWLLRNPLACRGRDSDRDARGGDSRRDPRLLSTPAARRLPGNRDAVLCGGVPGVHERVEPDDLRQGDHRGRQRDPAGRSAHLLRLPAHELEAALLLPGRRSRRGRRGSLSREPVTYGARLAGVAGGPARRRGDEHPRQPAQDPCVHLQLGSGRVVRRDLRGDPHVRRVDELQHRAADHHLRGHHPRRSRQHRRSLRRGDHHQLRVRVPRAADRPSRGQAVALLRRDHPADRDAEAVVQGRGSSSLGRSRAGSSSMPSSRRRPGRRGRPARRSPERAGSRTGSSSRR